MQIKRRSIVNFVDEEDRDEKSDGSQSLELALFLEFFDSFPHFITLSFFLGFSNDSLHQTFVA
jgi:hypothetical protein